MTTQTFNIRVTRTTQCSLDATVEIYIDGPKFSLTRHGRVIGMQIPDDSPTEREITIRIEAPKESESDW